MNNHLRTNRQGCDNPDRIEGEEILNALFPEGMIPEGGCVPPPATVCHHGMPPKPCPPLPPMAHDLYRTITVKLLRLVLGLQKAIRATEDSIDEIQDKIDGGNIKIDVDDFLSSESINPVQNKIIHAAIEKLKKSIASIETGGGGNSGGNGNEGEGGCNCVVDDELSPTSTNAVRNLAIYNAIKRLEDMIKNLGSSGGGGDEGGDEGGGGGDNPVTPPPSVDYRLVTAYSVSATKPARPTGGGYDFVLEQATPPLGGWSLNVPQNGRIWVSYNTFRSNDTNSGWTDPVEFLDFSGLFDKIEEQLDKMYEEMLANARKDLDSALKNLDDALLQAEQNQEQARQQLADAQKMLQDARDLLASIDESTGGAGGSLDEALAKINLFTEWYDKNAETITNLSLELDGIKGTITQQGQHIDTLENTVTGVQTTLNAHEGTITSLGTRLDTVEWTVTNVKSELDAAKGTITQQAQKIDTINGTISTVQTKLDAAEANITLQASKIDTVNRTLGDVSTRLDAANRTITSQATSIDQLNSSVTNVSNEINAQKASWTAKAEKLEADIAKIGELSVTPDMIKAAIAQDAQNGGTIGASIILAINNSESEAVIDADKIVLNGDVIARAIKTGGLTIYNSNNMAMTNLADDGSGFFAGGKLSWTKEGVLSLGNWTIGDTKITGGNITLDSIGKIYCKTSTNTYWSLDNDGQASFGNGKFLILPNGTVFQNRSGANTGAVVLDANGSGSLAWGNIAWDTEGNLSIAGNAFTISNTRLEYHGTLRDNIQSKIRLDWSGINIENSYTVSTNTYTCSITGEFVLLSEGNKSMQMSASGMMIVDGNGNRYNGASLTIDSESLKSGWKYKFVNGILVQIKP